MLKTFRRRTGRQSLWLGDEIDEVGLSRNHVSNAKRITTTSDSGPDSSDLPKGPKIGINWADYQRESSNAGEVNILPFLDPYEFQSNDEFTEPPKTYLKRFNRNGSLNNAQSKAKSSRRSLNGSSCNEAPEIFVGCGPLAPKKVQKSISSNCDSSSFFHHPASFIKKDEEVPGQERETLNAEVCKKSIFQRKRRLIEEKVSKSMENIRHDEILKNDPNISGNNLKRNKDANSYEAPLRKIFIIEKEIDLTSQTRKTLMIPTESKSSLPPSLPPLLPPSLPPPPLPPTLAPPSLPSASSGSLVPHMDSQEDEKSFLQLFPVIATAYATPPLLAASPVEDQKRLGVFAEERQDEGHEERRKESKLLLGQETSLSRTQRSSKNLQEMQGEGGGKWKSMVVKSRGRSGHGEKTTRNGLGKRRADEEGIGKGKGKEKRKRSGRGTGKESEGSVRKENKRKESKKEKGSKREEKSKEGLYVSSRSSLKVASDDEGVEREEEETNQDEDAIAEAQEMGEFASAQDDGQYALDGLCSAASAAATATAIAASTADSHSSPSLSLTPALIHSTAAMHASFHLNVVPQQKGAPTNERRRMRPCALLTKGNQSFPITEVCLSVPRHHSNYESAREGLLIFADLLSTSSTRAAICRNGLGQHLLTAACKCLGPTSAALDPTIRLAAAAVLISLTAPDVPLHLISSQAATALAALTVSAHPPEMDLLAGCVIADDLVIRDGLLSNHSFIDGMPTHFPPTPSSLLLNDPSPLYTYIRGFNKTDTSKSSNVESASKEINSDWEFPWENNKPRDSRSLWDLALSMDGEKKGEEQVKNPLASSSTTTSKATAVRAEALSSEKEWNSKLTALVQRVSGEDRGFWIRQFTELRGKSSVICSELPLILIALYRASASQLESLDQEGDQGAAVGSNFFTNTSNTTPSTMQFGSGLSGNLGEEKGGGKRQSGRGREREEGRRWQVKICDDEPTTESLALRAHYLIKTKANFAKMRLIPRIGQIIRGQSNALSLLLHASDLPSLVKKKEKKLNQEKMNPSFEMDLNLDYNPVEAAAKDDSPMDHCLTVNQRGILPYSSLVWELGLALAVLENATYCCRTLELDVVQTEVTIDDNSPLGFEVVTTRGKLEAYDGKRFKGKNCFEEEEKEDGTAQGEKEIRGQDSSFHSSLSPSSCCVPSPAPPFLPSKTSLVHVLLAVVHDLSDLVFGSKRVSDPHSTNKPHLNPLYNDPDSSRFRNLKGEPLKGNLQASFAWKALKNATAVLINITHELQDGVISVGAAGGAEIAAQLIAMCCFCDTNAPYPANGSRNEPISHVILENTAVNNMTNKRMKTYNWDLVFENYELIPIALGLAINLVADHEENRVKFVNASLEPKYVNQNFAMAEGAAYFTKLPSFRCQNDDGNVYSDYNNNHKDKLELNESKRPKIKGSFDAVNLDQCKDSLLQPYHAVSKPVPETLNLDLIRILCDLLNSLLDFEASDKARSYDTDGFESLTTPKECEKFRGERKKGTSLDCDEDEAGKQEEDDKEEENISKLDGWRKGARGEKKLALDRSLVLSEPENLSLQDKHAAEITISKRMEKTSVIKAYTSVLLACLIANAPPLLHQATTLMKEAGRPGLKTVAEGARKCLAFYVGIGAMRGHSRKVLEGVLKRMDEYIQDS